MESSPSGIKVLPCSPTTERGLTSVFTMTPDKKYLGYPLKNTVVLRSVEDMSSCKIMKKHQKVVSALAFHPNNEIAASGDVEGNLILWEISGFKEVNRYGSDKTLKGRIYGLQFSPDGKELLIYGEGSKVYAKSFIWETGEDNGALEKPNRTILSGCYSKEAPYKVLIGSEDGYIYLYDGTPLAFKKINRDHNGSYISTIVISQDNSKFIAISSDKKITMYDFEGNVVDTIDALKAENGHKMSLMNCAFLNEQQFITASLDKTVKIWDLKEKKVVFTLIPKEGKLDVQDMFCAVETDRKKIFGLTLNGVIYEWSVDALSDNKLPDNAYPGHLGAVSRVAYCKKTKEIISGDIAGLVLKWSENLKPQLLLKAEKGICGLQISSDESLIYVLDLNGTIYVLNNETNQVQNTLKNLVPGATNIVTSRICADELYALASNSITFVKNMGVKTKEKLKFNAKALEINEEAREILIGDNKGNLHIFEPISLKEKGSKNIHYGEYSCIKLSPDNKLIASGDNVHFILIYDAVTKEIINDRCDFHNSKVFDLDWSPDSKTLVSVSLDNNAMLWDMDSKKRLKNFVGVDLDILYACKFIGEGKEFICGGESCVLNKINV